MKKLFCTILAVMTLASVMCVQAFAAGNGCPYCANSIISIEGEHSHYDNGNLVTVDENGNIIDTKPADNATTNSGNEDNDKEAEYAAQRALIDKYCFTSGSRGSASSTGIIGAIDGEVGYLEFVTNEKHPTDDVTWELKDSVLTIAGNGKPMGSVIWGADYVPFTNNEHIETIVIEEGITSIPSDMFRNMPNLKTVIIMDTSTVLGVVTAECYNLETIIWGANLLDNKINHMPTLNGQLKLTRINEVKTGNRVNGENDTSVNIVVLNSEYNDWNTAVANAKAAITNADLPAEVLSKLPAELGGDGYEPPDLVGNMSVSAWAKDYMQTALENDLVPDTLKNIDFTKPITRAEFCALAVQTYEQLTGEQLSGYAYAMDCTWDSQPFNDISAHKHASAIEKAYGLNIINGYGNNKFGPDDTLTREQSAVILSRLAEALGKPMARAATPYVDTNTDWSADGISVCYGAGVMTGTTATTFDPLAPYTAEQSVVTMVRIMEYVGK